MRDPRDAWGPWYPAHFNSEEARDRFLLTVATLGPGGYEAEPMAGQARGAWVRWRPGEFVVLNDTAHLHGGRIVVIEKRDSW